MEPSELTECRNAVRIEGQQVLDNINDAILVTEVILPPLEGIILLRS